MSAWNKPGKQIVGVRANTIDDFKKRLDEFMDEDEGWYSVNMNFLVYADWPYADFIFMLNFGGRAQVSVNLRGGCQYNNGKT